MATDTNGYISRGNMSIILVAAGLILGGFGWFTNNQTSTINSRIDEIRAVQQHVIGRTEHDEFKLRIDKDIARLAEDALRRQQAVVPRTEHEARWAASDRNIELLSTRLNELRTATTSTYTMRDEVQRLQSEVLELRRSLMDRK